MWVSSAFEKSKFQNGIADILALVIVAKGAFSVLWRRRRDITEEGLDFWAAEVPASTSRREVISHEIAF